MPDTKPDTPRTDAQVSIHDEADPSVPRSAGYNDLLNHARDLERALSAAEAEKCECKEVIRKVRSALKTDVLTDVIEGARNVMERLSAAEAERDEARGLVAGVNKALMERGFVNIPELFTIYDAALKQRDRYQSERESALASRAGLVEALRSVRRISAEAFIEWDADNDPRVGKMLGALAGKRGYRADIDAIHDALASAETPNEVTAETQDKETGGMVSVPREPTDEMMNAYWHSIENQRAGDPRDLCRLRYAAMLAAAQPSVDEEKS